MTISLKQSSKFFGVSVICACATFVCNMFLNYGADLKKLTVQENSKQLYELLLLNNKVVCLVAGLGLALSAAAMLAFYVLRYIEKNSRTFGILKAMGYSEIKIAKSCYVFALCVFIGTAAGVALSWAVMPAFYEKQNMGSDLIKVTLSFNALPTILLIVLPTAFFAVFSIGVAYIKLKLPALSLIKGEFKREREMKENKRERDSSFLIQAAKNSLCNKKLLTFFMAFGGFCFGSMLQMALSMRTYASDLMGIIMAVIGVVLAIVSLWLSMTVLIDDNAKSIAMMKAFGYSTLKCRFCVLGLQRIPAWIGFAVGTIYQWGLLNIMVNLVFSSLDGVPSFSFNFKYFAIALAAFILFYEFLNFTYYFVVLKTPVKYVMSE